MEDMSQDAKFLLHQIRGRLKENKNNSFYFVEGIQSIAFGPLIGPDNIIPPTSNMPSQELQRLRQRTALALKELVSCGLISFHEQVEGSKIYMMNENISDQNIGL